MHWKLVPSKQGLEPIKWLRTINALEKFEIFVEWCKKLKGQILKNTQV
jgi:hypothetical protein